jgi:hypothetical protein
MKTYVLCVLAGFMLVTPSLVAQNNETASPTIPEEARKHFVIGATLFKDAKTPDDFIQVEGEFKQAANLAPQWPDPRYNLALTEEAAGDYAKAVADLTIYQQFKLSDEDGRKIQDKIYVLEAKQAKKASEDAAKAAAEAARAPHFEGTWDIARDGHPDTRWSFSIRGPVTADISDLFAIPKMPQDGSGVELKSHDNQLSEFKTSERRVTFRVTYDYVMWLPSLGKTGYFNFNDMVSDYDLTLSDDGKTLDGTCATSMAGGNFTSEKISFMRR